MEREKKDMLLVHCSSWWFEEVVGEEQEREATAAVAQFVSL